MEAEDGDAHGDGSLGIEIVFDLGYDAEAVQTSFQGKEEIPVLQLAGIRLYGRVLKEELV